MSAKTFWVLFVVLCFAVVLSGCGGGGGSSPASSVGASLDITVDTVPHDTGITPVSHVKSFVVSECPLDVDTNAVQVRDFKTGNLLASGKLDKDGHCTIASIPAGMTILVQATGFRAGNGYRLSTIIPLTSQVSQSCLITPVTSITTEAIAKKHYLKGEMIDAGTFGKVEAIVAEWAHSNGEADYSLAGSLILPLTGKTLGKDDTLGTSLQTIKAAVPDTIDSNLILAKNAVQQIKEAGKPFAELVSLEGPSAKTILTDSVRTAYSQLGSRISKLLFPALNGDLWLEGEDTNLLDLPLGHKFAGTYYDDSWVEIIDTGLSAPSNEIDITVTDYNSQNALTLKAVKGSTGWVVTETSAADSKLVYTVNIPLTNDSTKPPYTGKINLIDSDLTSAVTFDGTFSAVGADKHHWTQMTFVGTISGPKVTATGTFQANFVSALPSGAETDQTIYDFPTSFTMSNASITAKNGSDTIKLSGSLNATATIVQVDGHPEMWPNHIAINGAYSDSISELAFTGSITGNWTNPAQGIDETKASGNLSIKGDLTRPSHAGYHAAIDATMNNGALNISNIDLAVGIYSLKGTGSGTVTKSGLVNATLDLTNQDSVKFNMTTNSGGSLNTGTIKSGGIQEATIAKVGSLLKVTFVDNTYVEF